jgi:hypothetical protein
LFIQALLQFPIGAESVDFCSKSHVTHFSQSLVDKLVASELGKEHLQLVVLKALGIVEVGEWLWIGVRVTAVDRAVYPYQQNSTKLTALSLTCHHFYLFSTYRYQNKLQ